MALFLFHPSSLRGGMNWGGVIKKTRGCNSRRRGINGEDKLEVWAEMARSWLRGARFYSRSMTRCWWETVFLLLRFEIIVLSLSPRLWSILVSSSGASMKREISWQGLCERANGIVLALRSLIFINDLCISIQDYDKAFQRYEIFLWN